MKRAHSWYNIISVHVNDLNINNTCSICHVLHLYKISCPQMLRKVISFLNLCHLKTRAIIVYKMNLFPGDAHVTVSLLRDYTSIVQCKSNCRTYHYSVS